jgi:hypothetical protein
VDGSERWEADGGADIMGCTASEAAASEAAPVSGGAGLSAARCAESRAEGRPPLPLPPPPPLLPEAWEAL